MRISIILAIVFTHAYRIMHLTNFLPVAYRVFFLVIVPHIKAFVVLTPPLHAHILHGMLALMNIFSLFQILPVPLLLLTSVSQIFLNTAPLNHLLAHHLLLLRGSLLLLLAIFVRMILLLSPCRFPLLLRSPHLLQLRSRPYLPLRRLWFLLLLLWTRFIPLLQQLLPLIP